MSQFWWKLSISYLQQFWSTTEWNQGKSTCKGTITQKDDRRCFACRDEQQQTGQVLWNTSFPIDLFFVMKICFNFSEIEIVVNFFPINNIHTGWRHISSRECGAKGGREVVMLGSQSKNWKRRPDAEAKSWTCEKEIAEVLFPSEAAAFVKTSSRVCCIHWEK